MIRLSLSELFVALVEPSQVQARVIQAELEQLGVRHVEHYASGTRALEAMADSPPDLVISAMHLPDITGTELVQRLRADERLREVAFMLVSSETGRRYLEPVRQAGVVAILPKPFRSEDLQRALRATLDLLNPDEIGDVGEIELEHLKVLVVDDSPTARRFVRRVLENLGLERFVEANNGREAAQRIDEELFDLVVTDYNMPEMDGAELTDYIRNKSGQATVPILMVTSESNDGRLSAVQQAGVSAICDKPFEPQTVRELLGRLLAE